MVLYTLIVVFTVAITRLLAYWGIYFLKNGEIKLIENVFHLTYVENTGAAFGIFSSSTVFLSIIGILIFLAVTYIVSSRKNLGLYVKILLACLAGGGLSNVCDRLFFGFVVDYFNFCLIDYPVFNLADIFVVVSCLLIMIKIIFAKEERKEAKKIGNN